MTVSTGTSMRAWQVGALGEPAHVLRRVDLQIPAAGAGQLAVRVLAAAANFPDVLLCRGTYQSRPPLPFVPGVEVCGEVTAVGPGVHGFSVGDRVAGLSALPHGGFAEHCLLTATTTVPAPPSLSDEEAAAFYINYQTGWLGLVRRARLVAGETLLVHAASGGVGTAAVQIGKALGARIIGVVGNADKEALARRVGADEVVNRRDVDIAEAVNALTDGRGVDVVFDPVGGESFQRSTKCIAFEGRILVVGFASGTIPAPSLNHALVKNYSLVGLHAGLYGRRDPQAVQQVHAELLPLVENGFLRPVVALRDLDDVPRGLTDLAEGRTSGRSVFRVAETNRT